MADIIINGQIYSRVKTITVQTADGGTQVFSTTSSTTPLSSFKFYKNTLIKFVGSETDVVIPSSYSIDGYTPNTLTFNNTSEFEDYCETNSEYLMENTIECTSVPLGVTVSINYNNYRDYLNDEYFPVTATVETPNIVNGNDYIITNIKDGAFHDNKSLQSVVISENVTSVGYRVFSGCTALMSITISNSVSSIRNNAFYNCDNLVNIVVKEGNTVYDSRDNCNAIIEIATNTLIIGCKNTIIPTSVTSIGNSAFSSCMLKNITIPNSVTGIRNNAFSGCTALMSITIPNSVTSIGNEAFNKCTALTYITIPSGVTSIGNSAFFSCTALNNITIPNSVTSIGNSAFYQCSSLQSVVISENVTSVEYSAFHNCTALNNITIPNGVTSIGNSAFSNCSSLASITIPSSVTSIEQYAFYECNSLRKMTIQSTTPPTLSNTNAISSATTTIYIPHGTLSAYQSATNWSSFASKFVELNADGSIPA